MTRLTSIQPHWAVEGGRVTIHGSGFPVDKPHLPQVTIGDASARAVSINLERILHFQGLPERALQTVLMLLAAFTFLIFRGGDVHLSGGSAYSVLKRQ